MNVFTRTYNSLSEKSEKLNNYIEDSEKLTVVQSALEILQELTSDTDYADATEILASFISEEGIFRQSLGIISGSSKEDLFSSLQKCRVKDYVQSAESFSSYVSVLQLLTQAVSKSPKILKIFEQFLETSETTCTAGSTLRSFQKIKKLDSTDSNRKIVKTYLSTAAKILPIGLSALNISSLSLTFCLTVAAIADPILALTDVFIPHTKSHEEELKDLKKSILKEIGEQYEATTQYIDTLKDIPEFLRIEMKYQLSLDKDHFDMEFAKDATILLDRLEDYEKFGYEVLKLNGLCIAKPDASEKLEELKEQIKELLKNSQV